MASLHDHPTVQAISRRTTPSTTPLSLSVRELKELSLKLGADDAGCISLSRPELDDQRGDILRAFPHTQSLLSFVCRMNREPIRSVARSASNLEFHHTTDQVNEVSHRLVKHFESLGIRALNASAGFPMEMSQFPGKVWFVSHKPVAVAAGLGQMGIHRNVIHPKFGNFILLGTVLLDMPLPEDTHPINYNPCLECKLCVAACPVGAIKSDGNFDPGACMTHNYREFMSGFTDWVEKVVDSKDPIEYRKKVSDSETASMWQSLSFGANYKAAYCLAVCPAGEDVIGPFLKDRAEFLRSVVNPLQEKVETLYVVPHSDAEEFAAKRFPHKTRALVPSIRPASITGFIKGLHIVFQRGKSKGIDATFHFCFHGTEEAAATVTIKDQTVTVKDGLTGTPDCLIQADSATWLGFLRKEKSIVWAVITRKVRISGKRALLREFARCFPG